VAVQLDPQSLTDLGLLAVRLVVGLTFAAHGAQKALGWWGGPGFAGWKGAVGRMRYSPTGFWAVVSAYIELAGGLLFAAGLLTPLVAALLVAQSLVIVLRVHLPKGFWNAKGGIEFPLQLLTGSFLITLSGPGAFSLDGALGIEASGGLRLLAAVGAILGVLLALGSSRFGAPRADAPPPAPAR
jgi:putative oxidoreductase